MADSNRRQDKSHVGENQELSYFDQILSILNSITCAAHAQISANEILC